MAATAETAGPPLPSGVAEMTLEQYASLRAELELWPERAPAISRSHGVPVESRATLDAHWKARFSADPPLRMAFARLYAMHLASLQSGPASQALHEPSSKGGGAEEASTGAIDLTVQQYASLRVELEMSPDGAASILSRYRVPEEMHDALDATWRARLQADPLLQAEFARAHAAYLAWIKTRSRV